MNYKDIELSKSQTKLLKKLSKKTYIPKSIKDNPSNKFLTYYSFLEYYPHDHNYFVLSDNAHFYLRYRHKDKFRFWFPVILSIIALLISVLSLLISSGIL